MWSLALARRLRLADRRVVVSGGGTRAIADITCVHSPARIPTDTRRLSANGSQHRPACPTSPPRLTAPSVAARGHSSNVISGVQLTLEQMDQRHCSEGEFLAYSWDRFAS
jgi:hypothetical protein